ncbi:protein LSM12 isoform X2 [Bacillus rossius redtenbacheri]|uniref:protein LSM12 isoform X2 n=1 Tax=Bacillus rossius redtenbacheri TaxID=93214 RepID=UPI002FDE9090
MEIMAAVNECFSLGSTVACKTCFKQEIEGEVLAFDPQTKMLILSALKIMFKSSTKKTQSKYTGSHDYPLNIRVRNQIEEKRRLVKALAAGVSPDGQKLFLAISKTITDIAWQGSNIAVWNSVIITPPYKLDNVKGTPEKAVSHIKKVVEKYLKDQAMSESTPTVGLLPEASPVQL